MLEKKRAERHGQLLRINACSRTRCCEAAPRLHVLTGGRCASELVSAIKRATFGNKTKPATPPRECEHRAREPKKTKNALELAFEQAFELTNNQ